MTVLLASPGLLFAVPTRVNEPEPAALPETPAPAATEVVLLTNDGILPLTETPEELSVISATLPGATETEDRSLVRGLLGEDVSEVSVGVALPAGVPGADPISPSALSMPDGEPGMLLETFTAADFTGESLSQAVSTTVIASPQGDAIRLSGELTAPADGSYEFTLSGTGHGRLLINGVAFAESNPPPSDLLEGSKTLVTRDVAGRAYGSASVSLELSLGEVIEVVIEHSDAASDSPVVALTWSPPEGVTPPALEAAVEAARDASAVVIVVPELRTGEGAESSAEPTRLPIAMSLLVSSVVEANPRTAVVIDAASDPTLTAWVDLPGAVLFAPTGVAGMETIASMLLGTSEPTGSLDLALPPPAPEGQVSNEPDSQATPQEPPRFEPGHGLRYWGWELRELTIAMQSPISPPSTGPPGSSAAHVTIASTGTARGSAEVTLTAATAGSDERIPVGEQAVPLSPGESSTVAIPLDLSSIALSADDVWPLTVHATAGASTASAVVERPADARPSLPRNPQSLVHSAPRVPIVSEIVTVSGGLSLSIEGAGVLLSNAEVRGDRLLLTGALPTVTVLDTRESASRTGWTLAAQASDLVGENGVIEAGELGWTPRATTTVKGVKAGPTVSTLLSGGPGLADAAVLGKAIYSTSGSPASFGADLLLETSLWTAPGSYAGTLTVTLFPEE